jgi:hypothetical protein
MAEGTQAGVQVAEDRQHLLAFIRGSGGGGAGDLGFGCSEGGGG